MIATLLPSEKKDHLLSDDGIICLELDVTKEESMQALKVAIAKITEGRLDVLVNNAYVEQMRRLQTGLSTFGGGLCSRNRCPSIYMFLHRLTSNSSTGGFVRPSMHPHATSPSPRPLPKISTDRHTYFPPNPNRLHHASN